MDSTIRTLMLEALEWDFALAKEPFVARVSFGMCFDLQHSFVCAQERVMLQLC